MNKYEEAKEWFERIIDNEAYNERFQNVCKLAIELIEKATPKKAIAVKGWNDLYICPSCDENFFKGSMFLTTYCPYCGQSIDWSEEDE